MQRVMLSGVLAFNVCGGVCSLQLFIDESLCVSETLNAKRATLGERVFSWSESESSRSMVQKLSLFLLNKG